MKNILVALDLSQDSINALKYALLAQTDARFHVLYVYIQKFDPIESSADGSLTLKDASLSSLTDFICKNMGYTKLPEFIVPHVVEGEVIHQVRKFVDSQPIVAVYIGSREKYDIVDRWFGTTTLGVVRRIKIPVFVVPPDARYAGFKRVLVASDERIVKSGHLNELKTWNDQYKAFVKFLHIKQSEDDDFSKESEKIIESFYEKEQMDFAYEIEIKQHGNVAEAVIKEAAEFEADLIINVSVNQNYFQSLLFHTVTEELILNSKVPMLFWTHIK
jgi:nucleotide-binding universal stress UspA family protein